MCGVIGCALQRPLRDDDIVALRGMLDGLAHRGPDGAGEFIDTDRGLYLGHRRLSIIDLDGRSAQPMQGEAAVLSYNGEIYNYRDLRAELSSHANFKTESDTEVLLKAWEYWGAACLDKIDGMYAFAIADAKGVHLVSDLFGEKPLYVYTHEGGVYFSSEPQRLIEHFDLKWEPSEGHVADLLNFGYVRPPETGFKGLQALDTAQHWTIRQDGVIDKRTYWSPPAPHFGTGTVIPFDETQIDQMRDLLCASLEARLRSDVPIGLFLSGGVDSALVGALAAKELGISLESYTVSFPDGADESPYAAAIAEHLGLPHTLIPSQEDESWTDAPENLLSLYGVPNDNMTGFAVRAMCEQAKPYLSVALSGLGGDELFYGYNKYKTFYQNRVAYRAFDALPFLKPLLGALPFSKARTAHALLAGSTQDQYLRVKNGAASVEVTRAPEPFLDEYLSGLSHQARLFDVISTMPQSYIPAIDRGSMAASVEVRTPFLNRALLEYVWQLDQRALVHFGLKNMTRSLLARYMPIELLTPGKQGFVYPMSRYFQQKKEFPIPNGVKHASQIVSSARSGSQDHERLALRLCLLGALERSPSSS